MPNPENRDVLSDREGSADMQEALHDVLLDEERGDFGEKPRRALVAAALTAEAEKWQSDELRRLRAENERLRHGYCDEAYILMVQALDVKALAKGRRRILTEQAVRMAKVGLSKGWPRYQMRDVERRAEDVLRAHAPEELSGSFDEGDAPRNERRCDDCKEPVAWCRCVVSFDEQEDRRSRSFRDSEAPK